MDSRPDLEKEAQRLMPSAVIFGVPDPIELQRLRHEIVLALMKAETRGVEAARVAIAMPGPTPDQEAYLKKMADEAAKPVDMTQVIGGPRPNAS